MLTGGAETMLVDIINEQSRRGHRVELLVINSGINEEIMGHISPQVKVWRFNRHEGSMPLLLMARLNLFVLRRRPDIVHLHQNKLCGLLRVRRATTLFTVHDIHTPMRYCATNNMSAISEAVAADVLARVPDAKIGVVKNGIRIDSISQRRRGSSPEEFRIVQAGRIVCEKKGQDIVVDAVAELRRRGYNVTATFMGDGADRKALEQRARDLGIADRITVTGQLKRDELYARLGDFDIMCHPSRFEGFGLTIAEGMAAGLPLVVTEHDGPWEVAGKGRYCHSCPKGDVHAFANAIADIIDNYPAALATAAEARKYVEENFSVTSMVNGYEERYRALLKAARR